MDDYISRKVAVAAMTALRQEDIEAFGMVIPECFPSTSEIEALNKIPAADVRPVVRGAWEPNPRNPYWLDCTVCGYGKPGGAVYNFCPCCGADMRGDGEK